MPQCHCDLLYILGAELKSYQTQDTSDNVGRVDLRYYNVNCQIYKLLIPCFSFTSFFPPPLTSISNTFDVRVYTSATSQVAKKMQETLIATVMATAIVAVLVPGTAAPEDTCQIYTAADEPLLIRTVCWFIYLVCIGK